VTQHFLVASIWRGSLQRETMRLLTNIEQATAYSHELKPANENDGKYFSSYVRVYEASSDKPPVQIKKWK
jgi:hypothetical protein